MSTSFRLLGRAARRGMLAATVAAIAATAYAPAAVASATPYPETITLPNDAVAGNVGFQPEGLDIVGDTAYVGSYADGTVVTVDLRTGEAKPLVAADGDPALGVEVTSDLLLVAGQASGEVRVYDRRTGERIAVFDVTDTGLVNDIAVAGETAYFTDSFRPVLYALPLHGRTVGQPREIPLGGDFRMSTSGPLGQVFNSNGVVAVDADTLVLAQTDDTDGTGSALYRVDARTGHATRIQIHGGDIQGADGMALRGRQLYVVQYNTDSVTELRLSGDQTSATYVRTLTHDALAVPTTAAFGPRGALYTVNARFFTAPSDALSYEVVRLDR